MRLAPKSAMTPVAANLQEAALTAGMRRKPIPELIIASATQHHDAVLVRHRPQGNAKVTIRDR
jgi:hypothetical protein